MGRIVLFTGKSAYGTLNYWTEELSQAFNAMGIETFIIDLTDTFLLLENLHEAFSKPVRFCFSFNAMGYELQDFCRFFDKLRVPFIGAMVDPPFYHGRRLDTRGLDILFAFSDRSHLAHAKRCYPGRHYAFLPHAASRSLGEAPGERAVPIAFIGGFNDPEEVRRSWKNNMAKPVRRLLEEVVEVREADPYLDDEGAVSQVLQAKGMEFCPELELMAEKLYIRVNYYIRNSRRLRCLKILDEAGVAVSLFNDSWKGVKFCCHRQYPSVPYSEALELMAKSRFVLNIGPAHSDGAHERVLSAMAQGAVAVTDYASFYENFFREGEDLLLYNWERLEQLPEKIKKLSDDEEERKKIAARGKERALAGHSWPCRAKQILEMAEAFDAIVNY